MKTMTFTLRALAHLLSYPDAERREALPELRQALHGEGALSQPRLADLDALLERLGGTDTMAIEAAYVETFDRGRGTALDLFEHVHGDSRDRGPAMVDLVKTYEQAGLYLAPGELPDHLSVVLEYASTQPPEAAAGFLGEITHIVQVIHDNLLKRRSDHAGVLAAVLELGGAAARPDGATRAAAAEPSLDESWEEPPVFGGCSTQGQAGPGHAQPIQIVKRPLPAGGNVQHQPGAAS